MAGYARAPSDRSRRFDFHGVALAISKTQRVHAEPFAFGDGQYGGRVEAAAQENDGGREMRIQQRPRRRNLRRAELQRAFVSASNSSSGTSGFDSTASAPSNRMRSWPILSMLPLKMMTGMLDVSAPILSFFKVSSPDPPG